MEDIKSNAMAKLRKIPKEAFHRCFQQRQDWRSKCVCVCAQGSCFEGDYISVICPIITVLYHNYGKFLTAPRIMCTLNLYIWCDIFSFL
jgi:hypothetical protein